MSDIFFFTRQLIKRYLYTINHKRLGLNYFYFSLITGMSGAILATAIRLEMAYPGSPFFGGDSLKYLQVITAHALIMIFFVVVPIFFGGFANFLLPYHVGSKDVAFPRLNSLGFWIQPCGYLLIAKIGFLRTECWTNYDKTVNYFAAQQVNHFVNSWVNADFSKMPHSDIYDYAINNLKSFEFEEGKEIPLRWGNSSMHLGYFFFRFRRFLNLKQRITTDVIQTVKNDIPAEQLDDHLTFMNKFFLNHKEDGSIALDNLISWKLLFWKYIYMIPDSFWFLVTNSKLLKRQKRHIVKCSNAAQTVAGWTFITPFSSKIKYTGVGIQDMLILGVYYAGISTTISLINLLATRRTLSIPGLRNRRILMPFISITILLMLRALAVITPVLGSAMLMLALDRHWQTSFFDFAYGGDPIFFHHLFWFFGHPEVYVLVIPAFGIINSVIPSVNFRRIASKHHLIWAIYIMNYMGFIVWGHHMYLIGLDHRSRALYSTVTIMISMPATIKVVNWTFTLVNGALKNDLIFLSVVSFILFFLVAGFTGMWLSHVSLNISMHDTLYVVAHFHLMLSGAVIMAIFVGFYFYFPVFFQVKYSRSFGYSHIILYTGGQWLTFLPLFWVSFSGLPRRLHDFPAIYMGWQSMSTAGHFVTMFGVLSFYFMLFDSKLEKKLSAYIHTLIARFNKRCIYYLGKLINFKLTSTVYSFVPRYDVQKLSYMIMAGVNFLFIYDFVDKFAISLFSFIKILIIILIFIIIIATVTLIERKVLSLLQRRVGPNYVGYKGRLQFIADAVKLVVKHIYVLNGVNRLLFLLVPAMILITSFLFWANIVWAPNLAICEIEYNLFFMGVISGIFSYLLVLVGYISNNKYAVMASSRVVVMGLNLEILLNFFLISLAILFESLSFEKIGTLQTCLDWSIIIFLPIFPLVVITFFLETGRIPFDLAEAESELIAGYTTEYGGFFFALFYLGEYFHLYSFAAVYSVCLFGAWNLTSLFTYDQWLNFITYFSFEFYTNSFGLFFFSAIIFALWSIVFSSTFIHKVIYFILLLAASMCWNFWWHYGVIVLMILFTEFLVYLICFCLSWSLMFMFTSAWYIDFLTYCSSLMYIDFFELFLLSILFFSVWSIITIQSFRYKFIYFLLFLGSLGVWGFWLSYDGVILMMLLTEFLIILLFLLVFLTYKFQSKNNKKISKFFFLMYSILLAIYSFSLTFSTSKQFSIFNFVYAYGLDIVSNDLFLFFHFFFIEAPIIVVFIAIILGLISIFFVSVYYCFRYLQQRSDKKLNSILVLRKQLMSKQAYFRSSIRVFQK